MPFSLTNAVIQSIKILRNKSPLVVVGFGGFASGPGGLAAFLTRTPLVIHEQNAIAGLTNKVLKKVAKMTFQAFPGAFGVAEDRLVRASEKLKTVGNPVRSEILALNAIKHKAKKETKNILVIGGSRGALALNNNLPKVFKKLIDEKEINVRHQVGRNRLDETKKIYLQSGVNINDGAQSGSTVAVAEFIEDMAEAFSWADLVICRAGASTVSEVAAAGLCAIFVPYPHAVDDHQSANANWLVAQQAALSFSEKEVSQEAFFTEVKRLINSPLQIHQMGQNAKQMAFINAAQEVSDYCDIIKTEMKNNAESGKKVA